MESQEAQTKDPLKEGQAEWQESVWRMAKDWAGERGIVVSGVDIVKVMEYQLLDSLNHIYDEAEHG